MRSTFRFPVLRRVFAVSCMAALLGLLAPATTAYPAIVQRCATSDGGIAYTDGPCAAIGAQPAPMRIELLSRLASEARIEGAGAHTAARMMAGMASSSTTAPARRAAADGCARTPRQLARDLRASFALGDVNRLAESYHWAGMSTRAGERTLDRLHHLLGRQAVASRYYAAQIASLGDAGWGDADIRGGDAGILQVVFVDDGVQQAVEFAVHRYRDCYFVSF